MTTHIVLVRHGETDWNAEGRIQGHLPVPLNGRGVAQAEALAAHLRNLSFDAVYSSDLLRARQTAEAITRVSGHEIQEDERLREWDLGVLSGMLRSEAEGERPDAARIYRDHLVDEVMPGGESIRGRYERVTGAVGEIAARHAGGCVLVVTHGGPLGDCYRRAVGKGVEARVKINLYNASISSIRVEGTRWHLMAWCQIDHLETIGSLAHWRGRPGNGEA